MRKMSQILKCSFDAAAQAFFGQGQMTPRQLEIGRLKRKAFKLTIEWDLLISEADFLRRIGGLGCGSDG